MRISIEPEQLRSAGSGLQRSAEQLHTIAEHLNRMLYSFSQENESAWAAVMAKWEQARLLSEQFGQELFRLGQGLQVRSAAYDEEDRHFGSTFARGTGSYGQAASLYRTLRLGTDSLILPSAKFSPGVISNPRSAVDAVRREWHETRYGHQELKGTWDSGEPADSGQPDTLRWSSGNHTTPFSGLTRKKMAEKMILNEAALNPQPWVFTNPASGL
ncbi:hypothetical protein AWM70_05570 [Paenibacillus yonginensis]|uniref:WXG100 family type VII secretion target n=1 Tax=Paenibacillus yonginensis TaxID=1462996 RepID=A0A1B1MY55_9BACL|nr:hypothetical protein [Paenibacillus yonginensis]ANS74110.1 hypothetical protein AWM70_05570 [Paenibacillus yonginensis]